MAVCHYWRAVIARLEQNGRYSYKHYSYMIRQGNPVRPLHQRIHKTSLIPFLSRPFSKQKVHQSRLYREITNLVDGKYFRKFILVTGSEASELISGINVFKSLRILRVRKVSLQQTFAHWGLPSWEQRVYLTLITYYKTKAEPCILRLGYRTHVGVDRA